MKTHILLLLICGLITPAKAQLFTPESLSGAALGGLAGGIIGHNNGRKTAEGIAIGAGAGLLLGTLAHQARRDYYESSPAYYYPAPSPIYATPAPVVPAPVVTAPVYAYRPARPNYAVTGTLLGGIAGGIIGHNSGRKTAEGIAIGAGAGLLLGAVAESEARYHERHYVPAPPVVVRTVPPPVVYRTVPAPVVVQTHSVVAAPPKPAEPVQQVTIVNNYYGSGSSMNNANALFGR